MSKFPVTTDTRPLPIVARPFYPSLVRFPNRYSRTARGRRTACSGIHQTTNPARCQKRFGSQNGLSTNGSRMVPSGPMTDLLPGQAPGTRRVSSPPRAAKLRLLVAGELRVHGNLGRITLRQSVLAVLSTPASGGTRNPNLNLTPKTQRQPTNQRRKTPSETPTDNNGGARTVPRASATVP